MPRCGPGRLSRYAEWAGVGVTPAAALDGIAMDSDGAGLGEADAQRLASYRLAVPVSGRHQTKPARYVQRATRKPSARSAGHSGIEWARNTQASKLSERTLRDREQYWRQLEPVFGATHVDGLASEHMLRYFDARTSKVSAKKEIKFLSVLCNWAKSRGWMRSVNPVEGTTRQMKVDECRDVYVSDALYWLVYQCGNQIVRDCLDLALLCGLRPSEALGTKWADLHRAEDGSEELWIKLPKTMKSGVKIKRVRVVADLKVLLDRVRARGIVGQTILCDEKGQKLLLQGKFRFRFHKAREAAKKHIDALAVELGVEKLRELGLEWFPFQFRDLRPKAATDKERFAGMAETRRFLGHTTERQTADYVRDKIGELTDPVSASPPEWMAKVLSPKTHSSA